MPVAQRLSDIQEWEHGEATFVVVALGPAGLETVDTLIMAGIAATRAEAIRWALDRVRQGPVYQRLGELSGDAEVMDRDVLDTIEREIDQEMRARFPGTAVRQAVLLQYGDDPEIGPGDLWVRVLLDADGPEDYEPTLTAFRLANETAREQFANNRKPRHPGRPRARAISSGSGCRTSRAAGAREATLLARLGPAGGTRTAIAGTASQRSQGS